MKKPLDGFEIDDAALDYLASLNAFGVDHTEDWDSYSENYKQEFRDGTRAVLKGLYVVAGVLLNTSPYEDSEMEG